MINSIEGFTEVDKYTSDILEFTFAKMGLLFAPEEYGPAKMVESLNPSAPCQNCSRDWVLVV